VRPCGFIASATTSFTITILVMIAGRTSCQHIGKSSRQTGFSLLIGGKHARCDQAASLRVPSAKNERALEWTHCLSSSLITPALWRESAFMTIRAADAASLIGKINSMSHARRMAE